MLAKKNLDELNGQSRGYYERSLMKMNLSLVFAAFAFFFLALTCVAGTNAASLDYTVRNDDGSYQAQVGYGFSAFFYVLAFILASATSMYLSPLICGTKNESKILSTPHNIEGTDDPSAPHMPTAQAVPNLYAGYPEPSSALNKI